MSRARFTAACAGVFAALLGVWPCRAGQTVLVTTNASAPGAAGPFYTFSLPALLDSGEIRFAGTVTTNSNYVSSLYQVTPGSTNLIALASQGQPAPGTSAQFGAITYSSGLIMSANAGEAAFYAPLTGNGVSGASAQSFWATSGQGTQLLARGGMQAPGLPAGATFSDLDEFNAVFAGTSIAFSAQVTGTGVTGSNNVGIWTGSSVNDQTLVARFGMQAPDLAPGVVFRNVGGSLSHPVVNPSGRVAFAGALTGGGVQLGAGGIFVTTQTGLHPVAVSGQAVAEISGATLGLGFRNPDINDVGTVLFADAINGGGATSANNSGLFVGSAAGFAMVMRTGTPVAGLPSGETFTALLTDTTEPRLNHDGDIAILGSSTRTTCGIWVRTASDAITRAVARGGDAVPGITGAAFGASGFTDLAFNNAGDVAFIGTMTGTATATNTGIWIGDGIDLVRVVRSGDVINGKTVRVLSMYTGTNGHDGYASGLNDAGQLAYVASYTDFTASIVLWTPEARWRGPQPSSASAASHAAGTLDWSDRRNWTLSLVPGAIHDTTIAPSVSTTIAGPAGFTTMKSLTLGGGAGDVILTLPPNSHVSVSNALNVNANAVLDIQGTLQVAALSDAGLIRVGGSLVWGTATSTDSYAAALTLKNAGQLAGPSFDLSAGNYGLGIVEALDLFPSGGGSFGGESFDGHQLAVRWTLRGDTDLNGTVDFADLLRLARNYGTATNARWAQGDVDYDNQVSFSDLLALARSYGGTASGFAADWALAQALVPEPVATAALALCIGARRRRRN